jgi:predicted metal-dependent peptidase
MAALANIDDATLTAAHKVIQIARTIFKLKAPFWMPVMQKLAFVPTPGLGTYGVTKTYALLFDPITTIEWAAKEGDQCIAGVLAHECMHVMLKHVVRVGNRDPKRWNIAADLYINGILRECGWVIPSCGIFPEQFKHKITGQPLPVGLTADEYYDLLPDHENENGQGQGEGEGQEQGPCDGQCGSGAGGEPLPGEPADGEPATDENGQPLPERTEAEIETAITEAARQTAEEAARQAGDGWGSLAVWANQRLTPPQVRWQDVLRRRGRAITARIGRGRQRYNRPNRRQLCLGAHPRTPIMPVHEQTTCVLLYAIDTSGSMGNRDHAAVVSELIGAVGAGAEIWVTACDTRVQGEPVKLPKSRAAAEKMIGDLLKGGGGTNFHPIFEQAAAMKRKPDLIVVGTDGGGPAPTNDPGIAPTIWLNVTNHWPATWGERIRVRTN